MRCRVRGCWRKAFAARQNRPPAPRRNEDHFAGAESCTGKNTVTGRRLRRLPLCSYQQQPKHCNNMKKLLVAALALFCATAIMVQAQDAAPKKAKKALTPEQQTVQTEMLGKYDTNKDGKLDKTEKAAMSQTDKDKMTCLLYTSPSPRDGLLSR